MSGQTAENPEKKIQTRGRVEVFISSKPVCDLYTVVWYLGKETHFFAMGDDPYSPLGFNQYLGDGDIYKVGKHLGFQMPFIPFHLIRAIKDRISC